MIEIIPNWHPIFVHFTVALWSLAVLFSVSLPFIKSPSLHAEWIVLARWNLWLGSAFAIVTAVSGLLAFNSVAHDTPSHAAMSEHRNWALSTLALFLLLTLWSVWRYRRKVVTASTPFLVAMLLALVLLATTAWHGAEVVYRYGIGVKSLPKAEAQDGAGDGHDHDAMGMSDMDMSETIMPPDDHHEDGHDH
ncbi:MAG: DUF2231 domain-containing protein [Gammaproteobacteria bacterium]